MPRLTLQFEGRVLKEFSVGVVATIGRLPDNTVTIDNPAVSNRHARVIREGDQFVLEDLKSTNGTFVNEAAVSRHTLQDGDVVQIGKHKILFEELAGEEPAAPDDRAEPSMADMGGTVFLDTRKQKALLAHAHAMKSGAAPLGAAAATVEAVAPPHLGAAAAMPQPSAPKVAPKAPAPAGKVGILQVLFGKTDESEYALRGQTSLIGKSDTALVRLKGWFKPKVAVAISRKGEGYVAARLGGRPTVNNQPLNGRRDLLDGDVIRISGLTLEFRLK